MSSWLDYTINGLIVGNVYALVAVGLALIFGVSRLINFAQGSIYLVGAYIGWVAVVQLHTPLPLTITGLGALIVNLGCALILARVRDHQGSLTRAAFLSARNDAFANIAIIAAGLVTAFLWRSVWPDLIVGVGIALMNADAAREVWEAAHEEHKAAKA